LLVDVTAAGAGELDRGDAVGIVPVDGGAECFRNETQRHERARADDEGRDVDRLGLTVDRRLRRTDLQRDVAAVTGRVDRALRVDDARAEAFENAAQRNENASGLNDRRR
jgi:hypothetical protein